MAYRDVNGNEFESYGAACYYYGVDTPAQVAAEEAYWAEVEAHELALALLNDALIYTPEYAAFIRETARRAASPLLTDFDDDMPF